MNQKLLALLLQRIYIYIYILSVCIVLAETYVRIFKKCSQFWTQEAAKLIVCHIGEVESRDAVAERTQQLAEAALAEGIALGNVALLRSSAEMFALTACIGSDSKALHLLRVLCTAAATSPAPSRYSRTSISGREKKNTA
jgi:hypothetical protein